MNLADIARVARRAALDVMLRECIAVTTEPGRVEVVAYDPERACRAGSDVVEETGYRLNDHKVVIEVRRGILREMIAQKL